MSYPIVKQLQGTRATVLMDGSTKIMPQTVEEAINIIEELAAALEPFAAFIPYDWQHDTDEVLVKVGDLRRARAALAKLKGETNAD